jgi:hypothetical protein
MVSADDVLVRMVVSDGSRPTVRLNGRDVTAAFRPRQESGEYLALLTGLGRGNNELEARRGDLKARLELINHSIDGPLFSGPHQEPFVCQTDFNGLGPPEDNGCNARRAVQYYYKPRRPPPIDSSASMTLSMQLYLKAAPASLPAGFKPLDPTGALPEDVAEITLRDGRSVPYIIRRETGVINRAIYDIRFLHQPGTELPTPWTGRGGSWNGRLVYVFEGGCEAGYRQGVLQRAATHEALLAKGYAVATSSLNAFGNTCNDVISAETLSMVKEHFTKQYGEPVHTIGWGGSGGAMQLYLIAQNYPGLLDGMIPYIAFPDVVTYIQSRSDCMLLVHALAHTDLSWTEAQKTAVSGHATWRTCSGVIIGFGLDPRRCNAAVPSTQAYQPPDRRSGARCDIYDNEINVFGRDPATGFASRPLDNVGVQYGLLAFTSGKITADQWIDLNARIGGFDVDGDIVPERTKSDDSVVRRAYENGLVVSGAGGLRDIPIIDWRWYSDDLGDNHDSFRSFAARARLTATNGSAGNQVILIYPRESTFQMLLDNTTNGRPESSLVARQEQDLVDTMDRWLDNITADAGGGPPYLKAARDRPPDLSDACWATDGERFAGPSVFAAGAPCSQIYPRHGDARIAAGSPLSDDVVKCQLKPLAPSDYGRPLTPAQWQKLRAIFPTGVCDYTRPGVGQHVAASTWRRY